MSIPSSSTPVPQKVRELAHGVPVVPVWHNELGGLTFRAHGPKGTRFIKFVPLNDETDAAAEAERLAWAAGFTPVPRVIEFGSNETHEWLVTAGLPGRSAVSPEWTARPAVAVAALGAGLRALHEALPVADCPFDWSVASRDARASARGILVPTSLRTPPPIDRLVVCHGDACAPNTLLDDEGRWSGHVDLGSLGVADRWADITVAAMSTEWNYGPGWSGAVLAAYGVAPDEERMAFYRELWNAT